MPLEDRLRYEEDVLILSAGKYGGCEMTSDTIQVKKLAYHLVYHADVEKIDLPGIDEKNKSMIKRAIEDRLTAQPEVYGKPLQRTLKGYWKLRVGEYRIVFKPVGNEMRIFGIIHRKRVYQDIENRKRFKPHSTFLK